jgi:peptidoglycan/xylan/chitin deacetylase (PgdA/CDA1 family)
VTILCYHSVQPDWVSPLSITPEAFRAQAEWLAQQGRVLPLSEAVARLDRSGRIPAGATAMTFDDGFAALHEYALPVLTRHRLAATVFLVAETLTPQGRTVDWVDTPPPYPLRTLTVDQVREMQDDGVEFASHSYSHLDLTTLAYADCVADLRRSRELLEDLLHQRVPFLAYPRGRHDAHVRLAAERAGYSHAFTLPQTRERPGPFAVPRVGIFPGNDVRVMRLKLRRSYLPVRTSPVFPLLRRTLRRG